MHMCMHRERNSAGRVKGGRRRKMWKEGRKEERLVDGEFEEG